MDAFNFKEIQELTQICFQSKQYLNNFPQVFKPENSNYFVSLREQGKLVSFCTIYPTYFLVNQDEFSHQNYLKGFCIGSVCTHPNFRKKGFASQILTSALKKSLSYQADFVYLFSGKNNLYENNGFQLCGETFIAEVSQNSKLIKLAKNIKAKINRASLKIELFCLKEIQISNEKIVSQIWSFIIQHSFSMESTLSYLEFQDILQIHNMKLYYLVYNERIVAVCFFNKGDDFKGVIHGIYYSNKDFSILLISEVFQREKEQYSNINFFPGVFWSDFKDIFQYQLMPTMYVKTLKDNSYLFPKNDFSVLADKVYIRSLQGT